MKRCEICGETKAEMKKKGYDFDVITCKRCGETFCEACLLDGGGCPGCTDIIPIKQ